LREPGRQAKWLKLRSVPHIYNSALAPTPFMDSELSRLLLPIRSVDHVHGPENAPFALVEYGDYECPDCGRLYVILRDLQRDLASRLRIVFRHYTLSGIHHHAQQAAEAAEAAGAQGKFWEMHTLLFERQQALRTKDLIRYAEELTLDVEQFRNELKNETHSERVRADFIAGVQNGVYGTPGLFLNGVRYDDEWDKESLRSHLMSGDS
jgi:protein-disulfide isomerase